MQPDQFDTMKGKPLRMVREADAGRKMLINWPPEKEYHPPEFKTRTKSKFLMRLIMLSLAGYYYLTFHR